MFLTLDVRHEDMWHGDPFNRHDCAIARALRRAGKQARIPRAKGPWPYVSVDVGLMRVGKHMFETPSSLACVINDLMHGYMFLPFTMNLEIEE